MFGSEILEVAIGLVFVFAVVSILCSTMREVVEAWLKSRAALLELTIRELLHDRDGNGLAKSLYTHPLIFGLYTGDYRPKPVADPEKGFASLLAWIGKVWPLSLRRGRNLPSYIPAADFSHAILDIAVRGPVTDDVAGDPRSTPITAETVRASILELRSPAIQRVVLMALDTAQGDLDRARTRIEAWYTSAMDRVTGKYRRGTMTILFAAGLVVAVGFDVDALRIAQFLYQNEGVRTALVKRAEEAARPAASVQGQAAGTTVAAATGSAAAATGSAAGTGRSAFDPAATGSAAFDAAMRELHALELPIGWKLLPWDRRVWFERAGMATGSAGASSLAGGEPGEWQKGDFGRFRWEMVKALAGWLIVALAATFGAPFWFDVLNRLFSLRATAKPPEKREEAAREPQGDMAKSSPPAGPAGGAPGPKGPAPLVIAQPREEGDPEGEGCGLAVAVATSPDEDEPKATLDEDLPPAKGGVEPVSV